MGGHESPDEMRTVPWLAQPTTSIGNSTALPLEAQPAVRNQRGVVSSWIRLATSASIACMQSDERAIYKPGCGDSKLNEWNGPRPMCVKGSRLGHKRADRWQSVP